MEKLPIKEYIRKNYIHKEKKKKKIKKLEKQMEKELLTTWL